MFKKLFLLKLVIFPLVFLQLTAQEIIKQGTWETIDFQSKGMWKIEKSGTDHYFLLNEDFETENGPDLFVLVSKLPLNQLTDANTNSKSDIVGMLKTTDKSLFGKKMKGPIKLKFPPNINPNDYKSVVIHCVQYSHLWSGSSL